MTRTSDIKPLPDISQATIAYWKGHADALVGNTKCPYANGSAEWEQWWLGLGDGTQDMIDADREAYG